MNFVIVADEPLLLAAPAVSDSYAQESASCHLPVLVPSDAPPPRPARPRVGPAPVQGSVNRRIASRKAVKLSGQIYLGSSEWLACTVRDMSATGARLEIAPLEVRRHGQDPLPECFYLVIESLLERSEVECWVKWRRGNQAGVKFLGPIKVTVKKLSPLPVRKESKIRRR